MRHLACTGKANFNHFKSSLRMPVEQCFGRNYGLWGAASKAASPLRDPPFCNHDPPFCGRRRRRVLAPFPHGS